MKNTQTNRAIAFPQVVGSKSPGIWLKVAGLKLVLLALFAMGLAAPSARAQTTIKGTQNRAEVPVGFTGTVFLTNNVIRVATNGASVLDGTGTNWVITPLTLTLSGAPSGLTATIADSNSNTVSVVPINMNTNNASQSTNVNVKLVFDGTEASGVYPLVFNVAGGLTNDSTVVTVEVGKIWNGPNNTPINGAGNWSDPSQWLGGVPGPGDRVIFTDLGMQTNNLMGFSTATTNLLIDSIVDSSTTIASMRFCATNNTTNFANIYINPGVTLTLNGSDGFTMLRDFGYFNASKLNVLIAGTNGTFDVTNYNANFSMMIDGQIASVLDMSGLGNLRLDVNSLPIGDMLAYPNELNYETNGYNSGSTLLTSLPQKVLPTWKMAMTNYIRATYVDPYNYTNAGSRNYALVLGRNIVSGGSSGTDFSMNMGYSNVFYMDGICIAGYASLGSALNFLNPNSYALFRGANGGRMSIFVTADAAGLNYSTITTGDNTKASPGVDFTKGTVDMLVDRLYLSMDRTNVTASGKGTSQTSFIFSSGIIDANTAILGYQSQGNQTNASSCNATMTVTNTGVLKVNNTLALGYTTADIGSTANPAAGNGKIVIGPGGTVMANNITVGGVTKGSTGNSISLVGNANLIVSNSLADATPNGALGTLAMSGGNDAITLFINGNNPHIPLVYVTNLTASGVGNKLIIGGVTNLTFPAYVPLISGVGSPAISAASFDAGVVMPVGSGLTGTLVTSSSNTVDIQIINRTPNHLLWRALAGATGTANWDYSSKVWLDQVTGLMTNYSNPDICAFDDTPGLATNINIADSIPFSPGPINMTNSAVYYTFTSAGGNSVIGGPALNKYGTGTLEVDGNTTFNVQINQGTLVGTSSGSLGGVTVAAGAVMNYAGSMGGSVNCAGTGTSSGSIAGQLSVLSGGVFTNSGSLANPFTVLTNGFLYNTASGNMPNPGVGSIGAPQVAAGATFINNGKIGGVGSGAVLFINGVFNDLAGGSDFIRLQSVNIGPGGLFVPAGGTTGNTIFYSDGTGTFPGAALFNQGSTNVFELNPGGSPLNTVLSCAHLSFGGSASARSANGCTLQFLNVGGAYAIGQRFTLFNYDPEDGGGVPVANTGTSTNTYPSITPASPGNGMAWDLSKLWINGSIGVVSSQGPILTNNFYIDGTGTNFVGVFSWDTSLWNGYRLESLTAPLSQGLTATNWGGISGSWTNGWPGVITNNVDAVKGATNCVFYRLSFP